MLKEKTFAIFVVYADLNRAFKAAYKLPLTVSALAELIKNIVAYFKRSGFKPRDYPRPCVYLYLPYHPGALLSHENQLFLRELEVGLIEGQPPTIESMQIRKGECEIEETTTEKWRLVDQEEWNTSEIRVKFPRAKQSNVSLALDLALHDYDVAVLVAGDRDLVPAAKVVEGEKKKKVINVFIKSHWQETLGQHCSSFIDLRDLPALLHAPEAEASVGSIMQRPRTKLRVPLNRIQLFCQYQRPDGDQLKSYHFEKWVRQFGSSRNQEIAEVLLSEMDFYNTTTIKSMIEKVLDKKLKGQSSDSIGVATLGNPGDSSSLINYLCGTIFTKRRYHVENLSQLAQNPKIETVILPDDNLGSGKQAVTIFRQWYGDPKVELKEKHVTKLYDAVQDWLRSKRVLVVTCMAYEEGERHLQECVQDLGLQIEVEALVRHDGEVGCFHSASRVFSDESSRQEAQKLIEEIGYQLLKSKKNWDEEKLRRHALGYGNNQGLTVFYYNTPTSTLPIFWATGTYNGTPWYPVFLRREKDQLDSPAPEERNAVRLSNANL